MQGITLEIGNTKIENAITLPESSSEKVKNLDELIRAALESKDAMETGLLPNLYEQKARQIYPLLDISFLSMSNSIKYEGYQVQLPKFSVYSIDNNKFSFRLNVPRDNRSMAYAGAAFWGAVLGAVAGICSVEGNYANLNYEPLYYGLAGVVALESLVIPFAKWADPSKLKFEENIGEVFSKELIKGIVLRDRMGGITFSSTLEALMSTKAKEEIETAKSTFGDEIYVIAETKPEDWNAHIYDIVETKTPKNWNAPNYTMELKQVLRAKDKTSPRLNNLVVGVTGKAKDKAFLITAFN